MNELREAIESILFEIGRDAKLHQVDQENFILEIDYERYSSEILTLIMEYQKNYPGQTS